MVAAAGKVLEQEKRRPWRSSMESDNNGVLRVVVTFQLCVVEEAF